MQCPFLVGIQSIPESGLKAYKSDISRLTIRIFEKTNSQNELAFNQGTNILLTENLDARNTKYRHAIIQLNNFDSRLSPQTIDSRSRLYLINIVKTC